MAMLFFAAFCVMVLLVLVVIPLGLYWRGYTERPPQISLRKIFALTTILAVLLAVLLQVGRWRDGANEAAELERERANDEAERERVRANEQAEGERVEANAKLLP